MFRSSSHHNNENQNDEHLDGEQETGDNDATANDPLANTLDDFINNRLETVSSQLLTFLFNDYVK